MNRKEFFQQGGRWVILSVMGIMTAFLAVNNKIVKAEDCIISEQCKNCGKLSKCELPQAKKELNGK